MAVIVRIRGYCCRTGRTAIDWTTAYMDRGGKQLGFLAAFLIGLATMSPVSAADGPANEFSTSGPIVRIEVAPPQILIHGASRRQQIVVTAYTGNDGAIDVTHAAKLQVASELIAKVDGSVVQGVADGETTLAVSINGHESQVPLRVVGFDKYPAVHFANDIVPVLSKLGCNSGGCHGRAQGQNGFKLSVFGFDPRADYDAIVKEARGRRISPANPRESLILAKPTARRPHGGGQRFGESSLEYELFSQWIKQGFPIGSDQAPQLVGLEVFPRERVLSPSSNQQILATAIYSDGSQRDVSRAAQFASNAMEVAEVSPSGLIRCGSIPGEAAVTINYMGQVAVVVVQVPRAGITEPYPEIPVNNRIDELAWAKLRKMGLLPSELADDATFLRRLYLDVIGTLPTAAEVREFLSDPRPDRRARWIDRVLERPEYADFWALKWADILLVDKQKLGNRGAFEFHHWLREQFRANRSYDAWVHELVTASGNSAVAGPVNFYRVADTPDLLARSISQAFLGIRLECAQCHHHPFERWSQEDFYGMAGFFTGLEKKAISTDRVLLYFSGYKPNVIPLSNRPAPTKPPGGAEIGLPVQSDPRVNLADWMVAADNPWFSRLLANRLWKHFFGRGLVEPEDDIRTTNPATNEPLLSYLAGQAVESKFDQKAILRLILNSRVYQLSSQPIENNFDDDQYFSHHYLKRMPAEVMLDAICQVTGVPEDFPGQPRGTRAIELWDNRFPSYFLETFGRPARNSPCECGRTSEPTMSQALHLMNAPEISSKLADPRGRVAAMIEQIRMKKSASGPLDEQAEDDLISELTLTALGRPATEKEQSVGRALLRGDDLQTGAEDYLWALLNSYDFLFIR